MNATAFDMLQAARDLQGAGFEQRQAEAIATVVRASHGDLATKGDLAMLRADLYRAMWLPGAGIVATMSALAGIAIGLPALAGSAG